MKGAEVLPASASATAPYFVWEPPDHSLKILLKLSLVHSLKSWLTDPSNAETEVGGILLGSVEPNDGMTPVIRVDGYAPVRIAHDRGPTYTLTEKEKNQFGDEVTSAQRRTGMVGVGLVRSHIRRGLYLDIADAALFRRYFPGPSAVFLLLRDGPEAVGGFFWEAGDLQKQAPYARFVLDPQKLDNSTQELPVGRETEPVISKVQPATRARVPAPRSNSPTSRVRWTWLAAAAAGIAVLAGIAYELPRSRVSAKPGRMGLGLSLAHQGERLQLTWDVRSPLIEQASGGTLRVADGRNHAQKELNRAELLTGAAQYTPQSDDVNFSLEVHSGPLSSTESIRSIGARQAARTGGPANPAIHVTEPVQARSAAAPAAATPAETQSADRLAAPQNKTGKTPPTQVLPVRESKPAPAATQPAPAAAPQFSGSQVGKSGDKPPAPPAVRESKPPSAASPSVVAAAQRSSGPQAAKASERSSAPPPVRESKPPSSASRSVVASTLRSSGPQVAKASEKPSAAPPVRQSRPAPAASQPVTAATPRSTNPRVAGAADKRFTPPPTGVSQPVIVATAPPADSGARTPQTAELKLPQSPVALPPPAVHGLKPDLSAVRVPPPVPVFEFVGYEVTPESGFRKKMHLGEGESGDYVAPKATHEERPDVPRFVADTLSGDQRIEMRAAIDQTGKVTDVESLNSGANAWLTGASNTALRRWTFSPAKSKGRTVDCRVVVTFHFSRAAHSSNAANPAPARSASEN